MGFTEQLVFLYGNSEENTAQLSARLENNNFLVRQFFDLEDLVKASKSEQPFALIFSENVFRSKQNLKQFKHGLNPHFDIPPLIIMIGEESTLETRIAAANAGADFFFRAPVNVHQLIQYLRQQEDLLKLPTPRVLIVDDESNCLENYHSILSHSAVDVERVNTLSKLTHILDQFQPDIVL